VINSGILAKLKNLNDYAKKLGYTIEYLLSQLMVSYTTMKNLFILYEVLIFLGIFLILVLLFYLAWMPFVTTLQERTWIA
jgi:hypothetical protein